jgi:hypothetical protein
MTLLLILGLLVLMVVATGEATAQTKVACDVVSSQKQIPPHVAKTVCAAPF